MVVAEQLDQMGAVFNEMCEHVCGKPPPGLLDMSGVTTAQVANFYGAAAAFFRQAPWKQVGYEAAIRVGCGKFQGGPWYAVLMGQSGLATGLALYDDLEALQRMWAGERADEDNARQSVATTVTFGEEWDIPVADLEAMKRHGWPVARPDACSRTRVRSACRCSVWASRRRPCAWSIPWPQRSSRCMRGSLGLRVSVS
jgi:hypothetical protein